MHANILDRLVEPERVLMFRVPWKDDKEIFKLTEALELSLIQQ